MQSHPKTGVLPTVIIKAPHTTVESYEWNIQIPPTFLDNAVTNEIQLGRHKFTTGSLPKTDDCYVSGFLKIDAPGPSPWIRFVFNLPDKGGNLHFQLKPCTIDFMAHGKVVSSMQLEFRHGHTFCYVPVKAWLDLSGHLNASVDKLLITFFIQVHEDFTVHTLDSILTSAPNPLMDKFFNSTIFSDVVVCCEDKEFPAHRNILSAASSVFLKMFQSDTKEKNEGRLVIQDMDKTTVELLLKWMYSGQVETPDFHGILDLFKATHKYCIDPLKNWCVSQIVKDHLKLENALEIFVLADAYEEIILMEKAKQLIKIGKQQIFQDQNVYPEFLQRYPEFMRELFLQ